MNVLKDRKVFRQRLEDATDDFGATAEAVRTAAAMATVACFLVAVAAVAVMVGAMRE